MVVMNINVSKQRLWDKTMNSEHFLSKMTEVTTNEGKLIYNKS